MMHSEALPNRSRHQVLSYHSFSNYEQISEELARFRNVIIYLTESPATFSDVNKDWTHKDKDQSHKDKD